LEVVERCCRHQVQEIEGEEDKLVGAALVHGRLEPTDYRHALSVQRTELAVDVGGLHLQGAKRLDRAPVAMTV
jgi:hypothetical protein